MQHLSKEEIGRRVDGNYISFAADSEGIKGCLVSEDAFVTQFITRYQVPWMNGVLKTDANVDGILERVCQTLKSYSTPLTWRVGPLSQNTSALHDVLLAAGLSHYSEPCLRLNLAEYKASAPPAGLTVELVTTPKQVDDFMVPFCEGFSVPPDVAEHFRIYALEKIPVSKFPQKWFVGYCDGRPVSGVTWVAACGVNMIYNVCTIEEFRGRGFARRMAELAIESSLAEVDQPVCLYSSAMALQLYKRMGFVEQFLRNDYVYAPEVVQT
jgi:ribosomal protein S18 acetylase RimI-like enzyme